MRAQEFIKEDKEDKEDILVLPNLKVGDEIKIGRWKNRKAVIKGFKTDKNNHPIMKTNKGDQQVFKARISKLMPEKLKEYKIEKVYDDYHDVEIKVAVNPNWQILRNLLTRSEYNELRAYHSNGRFYFWDANQLIHSPMAKLLGLPYNDKERLELRIMSNDEVVLDHSEEMAEVYKQDPYINRNFDVEDHGWEYIVLKGSDGK